MILTYIHLAIKDIDDLAAPTRPDLCFQGSRSHLPRHVVKRFWEPELCSATARRAPVLQHLGDPWETHFQHPPGEAPLRKPIPELAVWLAAQDYMSCVVPLNGQLDDLRRLTGLMVANSGVKFPVAAPPHKETR